MRAKSEQPLAGIVPKLLAWFDRSARTLPWRSAPGVKRDPYRVWLSEIMLQQTTVPHAAPYFAAFTTRWPTVEALAAARDEDVMQAWAGLGYYARARNLLKCAREVVARGGFPETQAGLRTLPGIGPYTAGAVAALAFGERTPAVDGNAERVFARLLATKEDWAAAKKRIGVLARELVGLRGRLHHGPHETHMRAGCCLAALHRPHVVAAPAAQADHGGTDHRPLLPGAAAGA
jgi:A/G-specific adenine glycosylase